MAGDWIKIRVDLTDDPNVFMLSELLGLDCPTTVGHLVMFWGWMDRHTPDGKGIKLTESVIDKKIAVVGFAAALRKIGWLEGENMALELPNFERHNGDSAKARALESEAKRLRRGVESAGQKPSGIVVGQVSDISCPKSPTREEKRREEKNTTNQKTSVLPDDGLRMSQEIPIPAVIKKPELITKRGRKLTGTKLVAFELFWRAFDYKKARTAAADAWYDLEIEDDDMLDTILRSAAVFAKLRPSVQLSGQTPIYPQGWITGRRWEDQIDIPEGSMKVHTAASLRERLSDRSWAGA